MAKFLQKAIKHPGALTRAASEHGVSKRAEASHESHSSNPHIRARGILGKRLMKGGDLHHGHGHAHHDGDGHHASMHHGGMHHHEVNIHLHTGGKSGKGKHFKI